VNPAWIFGIAAILVVGFILDREIYFYEGTHLGPRVQAWLYDQWAKKYDAGKRESQLRDAEMLAQPLLDQLKDVPEPFLLDFATGTGRLSYALLNQSEFKGRIIALDLSLGMLEQAAAKLNGASTSGRTSTVPPLTTPVLVRLKPHGARAVAMPSGSARVELLRHQTLPLPFPAAAFDVVCALEVLELFPEMDAPLAEFSRVLRPGGVLLTSRGTEESGRRAKVKSQATFGALLGKHGFGEFEIKPWWKLFDRVIAKKDGDSEPVRTRTLAALLRCPTCGGSGPTQWRQDARQLRCGQCGRELSITGEGIVLC
jgi:ubiquinone/menaquinone biosynthesis C-methylase UbiE